MPLTNFPNGISSFGVPVVAGSGLAVGNVYHVIQTAQSFSGDFIKNRQTTYSDGSVSLHSTIATALAATVADRNDYVVTYPDTDDHDTAATLTISTKSTHLICPAGMGMSVGASNACRIEETGNYAVITVSGQAVEIAGLYFKNKATYAGITFGTDTWSPHVHHNNFALSVSGGTNKGAIIQTTTNTNSMGYGLIERNFIYSSGGGSATTQIMIDIGGPATCARVGLNQIVIGDGNTLTLGISNLAYKGQTWGNRLTQSAASGGSTAGVITTSVSISAGGSEWDNETSI